MLRFATTRLISLTLSLLAASIVIFAVIEVIPGDPASFMLGLNAEPDTVAALRDQLGLNGSVLARYVHWIGGLLSGDFGTSYTYRVPVSELVLARVWVSLPLAIYALILSTLIAFPVGLIAAARRGKASDIGIMGVTQLGIAVPNFWFAMLLVLIFAIKFHWFPAGGFPGWENGFWAAVKSLTLPAIALALPQASILARIMRSSVLDTLDQDYIRTARAKGLKESAVVMRHALRTALYPVVAYMGPAVAGLISGSFVVETIFFIPGLGSFFVNSAFNRDDTMVMGTVLFYAVLIIFFNLIVDILQMWMNPRTRND